MFSSVIQTMDRVEQVVLPDTSGFLTLSFKTSFAPDFTMISLTGTIMVQVSIIALSLRDLNKVHWTATPGFITSLIFGCLSVWMSVKASHILTSLDTPDSFRHWLSTGATKTGPNEYGRELKAYVESTAFRSNNVGIVRVNNDFRLVVEEDRTRKSIAKAEMKTSMEDIADSMIFDLLERNRTRRASFRSCAVLSAPKMLLNYSMVSFFAGLGMYGSTVWANNIDPAAVRATSSAIVTCYFGLIVNGLALFFVLTFLKEDEGTIRQVVGRKNVAEKESVGVESGTGSE